MKKTKSIRLTLLTAAAAAALSGCNSIPEAQVQRCVDGRNVMVDESNCQNQPYSSGSGGIYGGYYGPRYRWVYGGNGGYAPGSVVYGASDQPLGGLSTVRASELQSRGYTAGGGRVGITESGGFTSPSSRGGFGSMGHAFAGGGGEGGHGAGE
jgi:hypothetical protein